MEKSEQFFVLPGFARPVVVVLLIVVVLLVVAGATGGVQVAAGCESQVSNMLVNADNNSNKYGWTRN